MLLISGDRDPVGDMGKGVRRTADAFRKAGLSDVTLKLYPGLRHELLNEGPMRQTVYEDIWHWLEPHLPTPSQSFPATVSAWAAVCGSSGCPKPSTTTCA